MVRILKAFSGAMSRFRNVGLVGSGGAGSMSWYRFLAGTKFDYQREAGRVYDNSVVMAGANWMWKQAIFPRFYVQREVAEKLGKAQFEEVRKHPLAKAWNGGVYYDRTVLLHGLIISWFARGDAFLEIIRSDSEDIVGFVYLPHHLIEVCNDKDNPDGTKLVTYYRYLRPGGAHREIKPENMFHARWGIDPENMARGLSPLYGALRSVVGENRAATLTGALLANAGIAGLVFSPKEGKANLPQDPEKKEEFKRAIRNATQADAAGGPVVMPVPMDVTTVGFSPDKLALEITRKIDVARICSGMGIDPMILGLESDAKRFANFEEAIDTALVNGVLPMLTVIGIQMDFQVLTPNYPDSSGMSCAWDLSKVPALQEEETEKVERAGAAYHNDLISRNEAREMIGFGPVPGGDTFFSDQMAGMSEPKKALMAKITADARKRREGGNGALDDDGDEAAPNP